MANESVEVKNNKDGTVTITVTVPVDTSNFPWEIRNAIGKDGKISTVITPDPIKEASVIKYRACLAASEVCRQAAHSQILTDAEIEEQRLLEIQAANKKADSLKVYKIIEK